MFAQATEQHQRDNDQQRRQRRLVTASQPRAASRRRPHRPWDAIVSLPILSATEIGHGRFADVRLRRAHCCGGSLERAAGRETAGDVQPRPHLQAGGNAIEHRLGFERQHDVDVRSDIQTEEFAAA